MIHNTSASHPVIESLEPRECFSASVYTVTFGGSLATAPVAITGKVREVSGIVQPEDKPAVSRIVEPQD